VEERNFLALKQRGEAPLPFIDGSAQPTPATLKIN
jgi:hypothetical protein